MGAGGIASSSQDSDNHRLNARHAAARIQPHLEKAAYLRVRCMPGVRCVGYLRNLGGRYNARYSTFVRSASPPAHYREPAQLL